MALRDLWELVTSKRYAYEEQKIRGKLPFVHLFGHEKTYGMVQPHEFTNMVNSYKSWCYACAWKNATSVAMAKIDLFEVKKFADKDQELSPIYEHPFIDLINSVNPFSNRFELMTITQLFLELTGNAYWWTPKDSFGVPYMIWNIPAHWVRVVPSAEKFIAGYVVQVPGKGEKVPFDEDEVIHFKFPSPFNFFYGIGPTWAAQFGIDLNQEIKTWGINFFLNDARPGGILTTEQSLSPDSYQRLRDQWNQKYRGPKNAGKMAILENGLKYEQMGSNIKDARFDFVSREIRDEILAMFGVPASKLGLVEDVNRANAEMNDYTYQNDTILPRRILVEEKLNEKLVTKYDPRLYCKFENTVPQDKQFKLQEKQINIQTGITTIDEEREKEGLEPFNLPETSKPLIPFNLVPAGEEPPDLGIPNQPPAKSLKAHTRNERKWRTFALLTEPQERMLQTKLKDYFKSQHGDVMRSLHNFRSVRKDLFSQIIFSLKAANELLKNRTKENIRQAYIAGLKLGLQDTGGTIDFTFFEPTILRSVEQRAEFFADKVNRSTLDLLKNQINAGLENGESIEDIARRIDKVFSYSEDFRSRATARTEIIGATNDAQLKAYLESGVTEKQWLTARDEKVRDSHQIEGQRVGVTDTFTTGQGSKLLYPGDRSTGADASDLINCRCTVLPIIKGE